MSSGEKMKFEAMSIEDAARLFREIADGLEGNPPGADPFIPHDLTGFRKIKIGLKREADEYFVKMKIKPEKPVESEAADPDDPETAKFPKYKELKKRMKGNFKIILESLETDILPPETAVTAYLADSKLMIKYPKYGAEFFGDYDQTCARFREAYERHDSEACKVAVQELNRLKKECHSKFK